ncbi:hypothetical protein [Nibricoccus sp. IMCC34717]|uniref:hypothetical protein n=1 Tax=Nibricoccus sp. IMCC34717 TaxID=3034021 RepID=UPI00384D0C75
MYTKHISELIATEFEPPLARAERAIEEGGVGGIQGGTVLGVDQFLSFLPVGGVQTGANSGRRIDAVKAAAAGTALDQSEAFFHGSDTEKIAGPTPEH